MCRFKLFEDMISQGGGRIVADGGLNALPLVLQVQVWTSSPGACSYKDFADFVGYLWWGSWGPVAADVGFFWPNFNVFIPSTTDSVLLGQLWVWVSLRGNLLNLEFPWNGRHASYAMRYLEQSFQVIWVFGRATSMPWRHLCLRKSSWHLLNQHGINVFT